MPADVPTRVRAELLPLIEHVRRELGDGAARFRLRLQRVYQARLAMGSIGRAFRGLGLPCLRAGRASGRTGGCV
jgi:hypothetical protein